MAYYKTTTSKTPESILDLSFARLKPLPSTSPGVPHGFSVSKNGTNYEFFSSDKGVIDSWINALKGVCVLLTFHDDYKALKMIGRGSFAKVYLVESKANSKMYAVKAFTKESLIISNKSNAKPSMLNEIEIMRAVDHENVIKVYEVFETEKSIYLVLELIQGKSLQEILKKSNFKEEYSEIKMINMIRSILDALAYLAAKGVMHRDLKPDNILLDKGDKIKIVDFGLATFIDVEEYLFKKCGTPGYIAPEVFKYDPKNASTAYDHRCDVFSAGAILFYMLFGYPFFEGANASEILKMNRKYSLEFENLATLKAEAKNPNTKLNKDGLDLCLALLEFDQHKRLTAAQALNHSFFVPIPNEMIKIDGTNEVVSEALSRYNQNGTYNLKSPGKQDELIKQLKTNTTEKDKSSTGKPERYAEKDSLYLDLGKTEMTGKVDTLTNGSQNNSLMMIQRSDSVNAGSNGSLSHFAKGTLADQKKAGQNKSFKGSGNNFLKQAIFRNMEKNRETGEDSKEELSPSRLKDGRKLSAFGSYESPKDGDTDDVSVDNQDDLSPDKNAGKNNAGKRFTAFEKSRVEH